MDIQKYRLFVDLADTENLTRSGQRLGYTQSGASRVLKNLENELGFALFTRNRRGVTLTNAGEKLLPYARMLVKSSDHLNEVVASINGVESSTVTVGTYSSVSSHLLPKVADMFLKNQPGITLKIQEGGIEDLENWIISGMVDFSICSLRPRQNFEWMPLCEDSLMAIFAKDDPRSELEYFPVRDFQDVPFIMPDASMDCDIHDTLARYEVQPRVILSSIDDHTIASMVASGLGCSILPGLTVSDVRSDIKGVRLYPPVRRQLGIGAFSFNSLTPAANRFITYLKKVASEIELED